MWRNQLAVCRFSISKQSRFKNKDRSANFCLKIIYPSYSNFIISSLKGTAIWELFLKSDQIWLILTNQLWKNLKNEILQNFTDQRQKQINVTNSWKFQFKIKWRNMWRNQLAVCRFSVTNQWVLVHGGPCASWLPSENGKIYGPHLLSGKKYLLINHDWCRWLAERVIFSTRLNTVLQFLARTLKVF